LLCEGGTLISFIWPAQNPDLLDRLAGRATVLAMDAAHQPSTKDGCPEFNGNIAGYRAVIEAANNSLPGLLPQKVPPARCWCS